MGGYRCFSTRCMNASCGILTRPTCFMRFLPSFCFSSSFRLRVTSPAVALGQNVLAQGAKGFPRDDLVVHRGLDGHREQLRREISS